MEAAKSAAMGFVRNKENMVNVLLGAAVVALGVRSSWQQSEIEAMEAQKTSLRSENKAMTVALWDWRQHFFRLAESDPAAAPIPLARLRAIYGEEDPANAAPSDLAPDAYEDSVSIS